jgi:hypothetical protein
LLREDARRVVFFVSFSLSLSLSLTLQPV